MKWSNNAQDKPGVEVRTQRQEHNAKDQREIRPDDRFEDQSENDSWKITDSEQAKEPGNDTPSKQDHAQTEKRDDNPRKKTQTYTNNGKHNISGNETKAKNYHMEHFGEANIEEDNSQPFSPEQGPNRWSLDDLQKWSLSRTWQGANPAGASRVSLPPSRASSVVSLSSPKVGKLPLGQSLEQLTVHPEDTALPKPVRKKTSPFLRWVTGGPSSKVKKRSKKVSAPLQPAAAPEVLAYRTDVNLLAEHFSNLRNIAAAETLHDWSSRIVFYDYAASAQSHNPKRQEPWKNRAYAPSYRRFYRTLRNVSDDCVQRIILVEDLTPSLIDLLGATFQIPPHVFEEHLDRSGYRNDSELSDSTGSWNTRSSTRGHSSITWYRPVLPLIPITSNFRAKLIMNRKPTVPCIFDGCGRRHNLRLNALANIWRHHLDLSPEPGIHYKGSQTEYPVGWEERATIWTRDFDGCKFVVLFLDPLPVVDDNTGVRHRHPRQQPATLPNLWFRREERATKVRSHRIQGTPQAFGVHDWAQAFGVHDWMPPPPPPPDGSQPAAISSFLAPLPPSPRADSVPDERDQSRTTGAQIESPEDDLSPAALRRRATRTNIEHASISSGEEDNKAPKNRRRRPSGRTSQPVAPPRPPESDEGSLSAETHGPFVPYHPIRTRSSLSALYGDTLTALEMRTYIESLQIPTSTLDEFDYFLQLPMKGKENEHDPFRALLRAIHDDTLGLVDIIRISLRRIREGTLDEDLMQRRVTFWRSLLHQLNFNLADFDQRLQEFVDFAYESETRPLSFNPRNEQPSEKLANATRQTLRSCIDLIDRSSDSLRAEMQIVDSRRSIAEAESVAKLTELAFIFVPLSFVASLFSMQVHELDGGVPLYQVVLTATAFMFVAYAIRLGIRSSRLVEYKNNTLNRIREEEHLQYNEPIPTHTFLTWFGTTTSGAVFEMTKNFIAVFAPLILILAAIAAIISPIILLWLREIDKGFTAIITVLLLLLDMLLVYPVITNTSGKFEFNPKAMIRKIQRIREFSRKKREKAEKRLKKQAGLDPESQHIEDSDSSDDE